jgi:hypothetical protein
MSICLRWISAASLLLVLGDGAFGQLVELPKAEAPKADAPQAQPAKPDAAKGEPATAPEKPAEKPDEKTADKPAEAQTQKWEFGISIRAAGGPCAGLLGTFPVPMDWPEQQVKISNEQISPGVQHRYRTIDSIKQMIMNVPQLPSGGTAECFITFEVTRLPQKPPLDPARLIIPKSPPAEIKKYLGNSPLVEATSAKVRSLARELTADKETAWQQVQAILDGVRQQVKYERDSKDTFKGAIGALRDGKADREDMTAAFVAICRAAKIPARMVWPMDFCYAEFYLEESSADEPAVADEPAKPKPRPVVAGKSSKAKEPKGAWYPAIVHEQSELGACADARPIMQKGDNIKVPEEAAVQRYIKEFLRGKGGGGKPSVEFRRRQAF